MLHSACARVCKRREYKTGELRSLELHVCAHADEHFTAFSSLFYCLLLMAQIPFAPQILNLRYAEGKSVCDAASALIVCKSLSAHVLSEAREWADGHVWHKKGILLVCFHLPPFCIPFFVHKCFISYQIDSGPLHQLTTTYQQEFLVHNKNPFLYKII